MSKQGSGTIMSLHGGYDFKYDTKFEKRIKYEWIVISLGSSAAKSYTPHKWSLNQVGKKRLS